jgi:hypothetical protein
MMDKTPQTPFMMVIISANRKFLCCQREVGKRKTLR